jgi:hypothetical protein
VRATGPVRVRIRTPSNRQSTTVTTPTRHGCARTPSASLSAQQAGADAAYLPAGIDELPGLVAVSLGLPELLAEVSRFAVHAIPGADGAG